MPPLSESQLRQTEVLARRLIVALEVAMEQQSLSEEQLLAELEATKRQVYQERYGQEPGQTQFR